MEHDTLPAGFGMALSQNEKAVNAYAMMTKEQKQEILTKAQKAHSKEEMRKLVSDIAEQSIM